MKRWRFRWFALATVALVLTPTPAAAEESKTNIELRILVSSEGSESSERVYSAVVADGGSGNLVAGYRIPIPATTFNTNQTSDGGLVPVTSFTYQNVGFSASFSASLKDDGRIHVTARVDDSRVAHAGERPTLETTSQSAEVYLKPGVPVALSRAPGAASRTTFRIEARTID